ncbi:MAG: hypothetical protein QW273_02620 [Candidatus Pacearchaeota archaeon]
MELILILNLILSFNISTTILYFLFKKNKNAKRVRKAEILFLFFSYLLNTIIFLGFLIKKIDNSYSLLLQLIVLNVIFQSISIPKIVLEKKAHITLIYLIILIAFSSFLIGIMNIETLLLACFTLFLLYNLRISRIEELKKISMIGITYSSLAISMLIFILRNANIEYIYFILNSLFLIYLIITFKTVTKNEKSSTYYEKKDKKGILKFLESFVFIIILINILFISTISLHEAGHFILSLFLSCTNQKIIFEKGEINTIILCEDEKEKILATAGGIIFPFFVAAILYITSGKGWIGIEELITGFNFILIRKDLFNYGFSEAIILFTTFLGIVILLFGIYSLAKKKLEIEEEVI